MNGHPRDQAKVSVHCRWPLIRGNLTLKCVGRGIDNVAVQARWPLTTGVAQGRYYCTFKPKFISKPVHATHLLHILFTLSHAFVKTTLMHIPISQLSYTGTCYRLTTTSSPCLPPSLTAMSSIATTAPVPFRISADTTPGPLDETSTELGTSHA